MGKSSLLPCITRAPATDEGRQDGGGGGEQGRVKWGREEEKLGRRGRNQGGEAVGGNGSGDDSTHQILFPLAATSLPLSCLGLGIAK